GNSLTITGGPINIDTSVVLPGGTFTANANGGSIIVGAGGVIDVGGRVQQFIDVLASIGGGDINLASIGGAISIQSGALLNVGDVPGIFALNQTSAGTLTLSAPTGGVTIAAGTLRGQGPSIDSSGSFVLDTNTLAPGAEPSYDTLASML